MCGFIGWLHNPTLKNQMKAWGTIVWRGEIPGGWYGNWGGVICTRLPRSGDRDRPQPIIVNNRHILAFNGEIYSFPKNTAHLLRESHLSYSDSEFLAVLLSTCNDAKEIINEISGEFSFAFLDLVNRKIHLARDLLGTKPLFWAKSDNGVSFGSSARAVSYLQGYSLAIDYEKLRDIMEFGVTPSANIYQGVMSVAAGEIITLDSDNVIKYKLSGVSRRPTQQELNNALCKSLEVRCTSNEWLAFSGGVDSSLLRSLRPELPKFTADSKSIEIHISNGKEFTVSMRKHLVGEFARLAQFVDRPISKLSPIAMSLLAHEARRFGLENQISGEGADELFLGYGHTFQKGKLGHPALHRSKMLFDLADGIFKFKLPPRPSELFVHLLSTDNPLEWSWYDRWIRLPQHLTLLNSDLPTLANGAEARLPFLDLHCFDMSYDMEMDEPKAPLRRLLETLTVNWKIEKEKVGLYFRAGILSDNELIQIAEITPHIDISKVSLYEICNRFLRDSVYSSSDIYMILREALAQTVLQFYSLFIMNQSLEIELPDRLSYTNIDINGEITVAFAGDR